MATIQVTLVLAPLLFGVASLEARRWGPSVGRWLASLVGSVAIVLMQAITGRGLHAGTMAPGPR